MLLVNLLPNLLADQRIALFEENVHILYVAVMAQNNGFLLCFISFGQAKIKSIIKLA
jgi:hypothetical protein